MPFRNLISGVFFAIASLVASSKQTFADATFADPSLEAIVNAPRQETIAGHKIRLINQNNEIDTIVDGRTLQKDTQDQDIDAFIYGNYAIQDTPIVLIEYSPPGNACEAQFAALFLGQKISLTKEFGTCDSQPSVSVSGKELIATFTVANDQGTEVDAISEDGVTTSDVGPQLIGPSYSPGMDLGAMVLGQYILAPFELRATSEEIQSVVGQSVYDEISTYTLGLANVSSVGDYVTDDLCQPHNCGGAMVYLVFDHKGNAWVATSDGHTWTWYGNPPASVIATLSSQPGFQASSPANATINNDGSSETSTAGPQQPAADQNPLPMSSGSWTAMEDNGNFADTGSSGQQKIAMVLPQGTKHFKIFLTGFESNIPDGTTVVFNVTFDNGQSTSFSGESASNEVEADLEDNEVASWTHNLTADKMMAITFGGISEDPWSIPLSGTTPTVTAMAKGITLAGITGLPDPWSISAPDASSDQTDAPTSLTGNLVSQAQSQYPATPNTPIPPNPSFSDCTAFADYASNVPDLSDAQNSFGNYFQVNLASAPDSVFDDLSNFSSSCEMQIINQNVAARGQYPDYRRLISIFEAGPAQSSLQKIQSSNDEAAQAQQNAIDIQKNAVLIEGLPACDDQNTISEIKDSVANSPEGRVKGIEPPRVSRRLFGLSYAAIGMASCIA